MPGNAIKALMLPFAKDLLRVPARGLGCFIRADVDPAIPESLHAALVCEQTFKPASDRLVAGGFTTVTRLEGCYDTALCLLTNHRTENFGNIARAWTLLQPGGTLLCAGGNDVGAASIERKVVTALGLSGSLAKFHCRTFWTTKRSVAPPQDWAEHDRLAPNVEGRWITRPGIFSWNKVDEGSRLLVEGLPAVVWGEVADFGAGWGYLSLALAARYPEIARLDLYDAELLALEAAQANFAQAGGGGKVAFHWQDVAAGIGKDRCYDFIVMNPPFHAGKATDIALGQAFIAAAARALRPAGWLLMVANRQLPYEHVLRQSFAQVEKRRETPQFKLLFARL